MPVLNNSAISSADDRLQKALREADELYEEKVIDPKKIIEERKAFLEETISNTETDEYIQSQKERKRALMDEHKVNIDKLLEEKQEKMLDLGDTLYKAKLIQEKELEQSREDLFKDAKYRNEQDINSDYDALFDKERKLHEAYKQALNNKIKKMISSYPSLLKEENNKIKKVLKPYKKYIRFASRGLTAKKKDLAKKFNKLLKKELNEINQNYNRQISNI